VTKKNIMCRARDIIEVIRCQVIDFSGLRVVAVNCIMCEAGSNDLKPADETQTNTLTSCPCLVWVNTHTHTHTREKWRSDSLKASDYTFFSDRLQCLRQPAGGADLKGRTRK